MSRSTESKKEAAAKKAAISASLSELLRNATASPEAAQEALRIYSTLRRKPPLELVTQENVFQALPATDIARSLAQLSQSTDSINLSAPLTALRMKEVDEKSAVTVSKAINANIRKIIGLKSRSKAKATHVKEKRLVVFEKATVADAAAVILWLLIRLLEPRDRRRSPAGVAIDLIHTLDYVWRHSAKYETADIIVGFFRSLSSNVKRSVYVDLEDDPQIAAFTRDSDSALLDYAKFALTDGRLNELEKILRVLPDDGKRSELLQALAQLCQERASQTMPEVAEFIARRVEERSRKLQVPVAADESQSSALNYVSASLLAAWDASHEGRRAQRSLESAEKMAEELFKVKLLGTPGEIVMYDARSHVSDDSIVANSTQVRIVRPGVRWSDGIRTRVLVRATVKPMNK